MLLYLNSFGISCTILNMFPMPTYILYSYTILLYTSMHYMLQVSNEFITHSDCPASATPGLSPTPWRLLRAPVVAVFRRSTR